MQYHRRNRQGGVRRSLIGDENDPTTALERGELRRETVTTDHIEHHVNPAPALGDSTEILNACIDRHVSARRQRALCLFGTMRGRNPLCARRFRHLNGCNADARRSAVNQFLLPYGHRCRLNQA